MNPPNIFFQSVFFDYLRSNFSIKKFKILGMFEKPEKNYHLPYQNYYEIIVNVKEKY